MRTLYQTLQYYIDNIDCAHNITFKNKMSNPISEALKKIEYNICSCFEERSNYNVCIDIYINKTYKNKFIVLFVKFYTKYILQQFKLFLSKKSILSTLEDI